jgi:NitT/TauT family transport system permease protein
MRTLVNIAAPLILLALLLAGWEAACRLLAIPTYFLPPPSAIGRAVVENWPLLLRSAWNTLSFALQALVTASLVACTIAFLVALNATLERAVQPLAVVLQVTPVVAIAPQVAIWSGIDHPTRAVVALAALVAFFPIFSGALRGLKSADPDLERLFRLYGATSLQTLFRLRLPSAAPYLVEGHRVAMGLALVGAVVAEQVAGSGATQGLAWRITEAANRLQTARTFAALVVLSVLAVGLYGILKLLESYTRKWWGAR